MGTICTGRGRMWEKEGRRGRAGITGSPTETGEGGARGCPCSWTEVGQGVWSWDCFCFLYDTGSKISSETEARGAVLGFQERGGSRGVTEENGHLARLESQALTTGQRKSGPRSVMLHQSGTGNHLTRVTKKRQSKPRLNTLPPCSFSPSQECSFKPVHLESPGQQR